MRNIILIDLSEFFDRLKWMPMTVACENLTKNEKGSIREALFRIGGQILSRQNR
jgi:hypothetical protein